VNVSINTAQYTRILTVQTLATFFFRLIKHSINMEWYSTNRHT